MFGAPVKKKLYEACGSNPCNDTCSSTKRKSSFVRRRMILVMWEERPTSIRIPLR